MHVHTTDEKESDVNLASHMLRDGFMGLYEQPVVISNDSDLREAVKIVTRELRLQVGILNTASHRSRELQEHAIFVRRIRQRHLAAAQSPDQVTDERGSFTKPVTW